MNYIWGGMLIASIITSLLSLKPIDATAVMSTAAIESIELCIRLAGGFALWSGFIAIVKEIGIAGWIAKLVTRPLQFLLPSLKGNAPAQEAVTVNLVSNMLGLGNAATPAGLRAMKYMATNGSERATDAMCMFIIINATSVQLLPTSVIALRAAAGSASPSSIVLPTILATTLSTFLGIVLCLILRGEKK